MSDNDNRDLFEGDPRPRSDLLDELDSLKELLREQEHSIVAEDSSSGDTDIPVLDDVIDIDAMELEPVPELPESAIPVLEEVAFPADEPPVVQEIVASTAVEAPESAIPSEQELSKLIDMLVGHRLRRLRPKIKEEVLEELHRLYPELFR